MRLIPGDECARVYSYLGLDRAFRMAGAGAGAGLSGSLWQPWHLPGCVLACCTNTSAYPGAVVFPEDPCANGTFTGDASWTKGANWTLPGTTADKSAGAANNLTQACLTVGNTYTITYTINAVAGGTLTVYAGTTAGTARASAGTYTETLACAGNTSLGFVPSAAATTCQIDNVLVSPRNASQFTDLSGAGHHLVQATAAKQPLWVPSGAGGVLRFDGVADFLQTAAFTLAQPTTVFLLAGYTKKGAATYLTDGVGGTNLGVITHNGVADSLISFCGTSLLGPAFLSAQPYVIETCFNAASSYIRLNGGAKTSGQTGAGAPSMGGFTFGAAGNGAVSSICDGYAMNVYNRTLAESESQRVTRWCRRLGQQLGV
jgi:hypothetical protein